MPEIDWNKNRRICDLLSSVTAFNRRTLLDDLHELGEDAFLLKWEGKPLPNEKYTKEWLEGK